MTREQILGWSQAFFTVLVLWAVANVFMSYSTQVVEVNKLIFAISTYTSCSFCLLLYAGKGGLSRETLRSVDTWVYGIAMLINYFVMLHLYSAVTATEASLLERTSVIFGLLTGWIFLLRRPSKWQLLGALGVLSGIIVISHGLPPEKAGIVYVLIFLTGFFQSLRILVAELHRPHQQAAQQRSVKARCRVVGYVMFVITLIFMGILALLSFAHHLSPETVPASLALTWSDLLYSPSIILGMIMGVVIYVPLRYLEFSSSNIIKSENFIAVTSLSFLSTLFWEWLTQPITGLSLAELSVSDLVAGLLITAGGLTMALSKMKQNAQEAWKQYIGVQPQNLELIHDSREIVANTLEHFKGNVSKAATALEVPSSALQTLLNDDTQALGFHDKVIRKVARHYRDKVASTDPLTGLKTRNSLMCKLNQMIEAEQPFTVLYIDLNKFKPVNDTYGHAAGDAVLVEIAQRLQNICPPEGIVSRLGGDEFCLIVQAQQATKLQKELDKAFKQPISIDDKIQVDVGASIGLANYPNDSYSSEGLIKAADDSMYKIKKA